MSIAFDGLLVLATASLSTKRDSQVVKSELPGLAISIEHPLLYTHEDCGLTFGIQDVVGKMHQNAALVLNGHTTSERIPPPLQLRGSAVSRFPPCQLSISPAGEHSNLLSMSISKATKLQSYVGVAN